MPAMVLSELETWETRTAELARRLHQEAGLASKGMPEDQRWYYSKKWQKMEAEADREIADGKVSKVFDSVEEFLAALNA